MAKNTKILIVDDHAIFRHGLRDILKKNFPRVVTGDAESGEDAVKQVRRSPWSVVVLDVTLPGLSGIDVLLEIKQMRPSLPILMLSMHPEEQYAIRSLQAGAVGYITKIKAPVEIVKAINAVLAGGNYISPTLTGRLVEQFKPGAEKLPHDRLTNREYQVMRLTCCGKSLKQIAAELAISVQTVSTHRTRIMKKMGLHSSAGLIRYALKNELVD